MIFWNENFTFCGVCVIGLALSGFIALPPYRSSPSPDRSSQARWTSRPR
jgi:hypothetical protein